MIRVRSSSMLESDALGWIEVGCVGIDCSTGNIGYNPVNGTLRGYRQRSFESPGNG
jgi:hypothetical protein